MSVFKIFTKLIERLKQQQSFCPYCGGEHTHTDNDCVLKGLWFDGEEEYDEED